MEEYLRLLIATDGPTVLANRPNGMICVVEIIRTGY
jgi:hypothetical protein